MVVERLAAKGICHPCGHSKHSIHLIPLLGAENVGKGDEKKKKKGSRSLARLCILQ